MTVRVQPDLLIARDEIVAAPQRACQNHSFELPGRLYVAMASLLFGFLAVMAVGFAAPAMAVPMGVNFAFLAAFFTVPAIFVRVAPDKGALRWSEFMRNGVHTATGHASGAEAAILMLMLPFFILCWSITVVAIAALI